jgi:cell division protein FtsI (penicillin-binding protein 3)
MNKQVNSHDRKRLLFPAVFLAFLFCSLILRFYQIQIVQHNRWKEIALAQHQAVEIEPFMRGCFYSNTTVKKGHPEEPVPFVIDVQKFHLFIDPDSIPLPSKEKMAGELGALIQEDPTWIYSELMRKSRSRKAASWLGPVKRDEIANWWSVFSKREKIVKNAIYFKAEPKRSYPFGSMLGAVLHTVQEEKDPATGGALPTGGLEMLFNSYLQGKPGKRLILRSPRHPLDTGKILEAPEHGADVYLTINHYLQAIAESELAKGVQAAGGLGGWAVMMDPETGEILALAQTPSFNPARYREYYNDPSLLETTKVRAVTDCFEPGSIFKPINLAICLKASEELKREGKKPILIPEEWVLSSNGWFPGRSTPLKDARVHRFLNLNVALQKSSNIYPARAIQRLIETKGDAWYRKEFTETFGLGQKTGLELPAESVGLVPTPGKLHPNGKLEWSVPTPYSLAMGHNILVNSIQMARTYAILANGGFDVKPHLIRKIAKKSNDGKEQILLDKTEMKKGKRLLSDSIVETIIHGMKFVTKEGGTSKMGDIPGYTEVGKSGTAEKVIDGIYSKSHNISSFLGFAPAKNPRFVLLVSVDDPEIKYIPGVGKHQLGGVCAAPIFREIASRALQYLGVTPDDPYGYSPGDPRRDAKKADMLAEIVALKEEYLRHNE